MLDTLRHVIEAHGGLEKWNQHKALNVDLIIGGMLWGLKGQAGKLERTNVTVGLGKEWASHQPFGQDNRRTRFGPDRVAIEDAQGNVLEELAAPRASFAGHALETPWTEPQLAYFAGYPVFADSTPKNPILVRMQSTKHLEIHDYIEPPPPKTAVVKTYPIPIAGFASLDSPGHVFAANPAKEGWQDAQLLERR